MPRTILFLPWPLLRNEKYSKAKLKLGFKPYLIPLLSIHQSTDFFVVSCIPHSLQVFYLMFFQNSSFRTEFGGIHNSFSSWAGV